MMAEFADKEESKKDNDKSKGGDDDMKHNVFDNDKHDNKSFLSHAAQEEILKLAKPARLERSRMRWKSTRMIMRFSTTLLPAALFRPERAM